MTDNEFNSEFNKKLLYYRENVAATVYITIWAKISFAFAVTYTQLMHDVYMYVYVVHVLRAYHCKSKAGLCLYSYINSCYNIFTIIR